MRTLPEAARLLKEEDPQTAITLTALRRMVKQGRIPVAMMGNKPLMDMDRIREFLYMPIQVEKPTPGKIRPVKE